MVDLLGRPCCVDCFDNCLKRDTPKKSTPRVSKTTGAINSESPKPDSSNVGGLSKAPQGIKIRESSPTIEELEQRLGISRSREGSPALEGLPKRLNTVNTDTNHHRSSGSSSPTPLSKRSGSRSSYPIPSSKQSPIHRQITSSPVANIEAIQEMKQRLINNTSNTASKSSSPSLSTGLKSPSRERLSNATNSPARRNDAVHRTLPPTPDLMSDFSESSASEPSDSPPRRSEVDDAGFFSPRSNQGKMQNRMSWYSRGDSLDPINDVIVEETNSQMNTPTKTPNQDDTTPMKTSMGVSPLQFRKKSSPPSVVDSGNSRAHSACFKCGGKLFTIDDQSTFVTLPSADEEKPAEVYHANCFTCYVCDGLFQSERKGQASFVRHRGKPCHSEVRFYPNSIHF